MTFQEFLVLSGFLKKDEWLAIETTRIQDSHALPRARDVTVGKTPIGITRPLFGDVLKKMPFFQQVLATADVSSLEELLEKYYEWHRANMQPISSYCQALEYGKSMYDRVDDKRLVARFVCTSRLPNHTALVYDGDTVAIPDGSSAYYVGAALAQCRSDVTIITSNVQLEREYRENPALSSALSSLHVIGGLADKDSRFGGTFGTHAIAAYDRVFEHEPKTKVIVISVSAFDPIEGPYASKGMVSDLKSALIQQGRKHHVREIIFIAHYEKLLRNSGRWYGSPVLSRHDWEALFNECGKGVSIITTPTPTIRQACEDGIVPADPLQRNLRDLTSSGCKLVEHDFTYDGIAKKFCERWMSKINDFAPRFFEAVYPRRRKGAPDSTAAQSV